MVKINPAPSPLPLWRSAELLGAGQKIIVIVGPTASGKSDLGIKIAQKFNGEIISADSRQVYRGMDIGTGKVLRDRYKGHLCNTKMPFVSSGIEHHLVDVANPKKQFTANDFKKLGRKAITDITSRNKIPIIVGGTGFYIDVLLGRMLIAEVQPDKKLRARFDKLTVECLFEMLQKLDPERAKTVESKNKRRIIRALEIVIITGKPAPFFAKASEGNPKYNLLWIGLKPKNLEQKIKRRLDARLKQGMLKEIEKLRKQGMSWKRLGDLGLEYRWIARYLQNSKQIQNSRPEGARLAQQSWAAKLQFKNFKKSEYYEKLLREIIKYSKRQMTWFTQPHPWEKNNPKNIHWASSSLQASKIVNDFLKQGWGWVQEK